MRTRQMKLSDHGVPPEDEPRLRRICQTGTAEQLDLLRQAIASAAPGIEQAIFDNLTLPKKQKGYETLSKRNYIPVTKADFYAYQRKTLAEFYRLLRLLGMWRED